MRKGNNISKKEILDAEVKKMLQAGNPLHGIYGLYGDCPNDPHLLERSYKTDVIRKENNSDEATKE
jgi:hypothetical protein